MGRRRLPHGAAAAAERAALLVALAAGLAVAFGAVAGVLAEPVARTAAGAVALRPADVGLGDLQRLDERTVVVDRDGERLAILRRGDDRMAASLEEVPDHVVDAVLTAEDRRFHDHRGYDVRALARATSRMLAHGEVVEGGSTITQQLAKLNVVGAEHSLERKLRELAVAMDLERRLDKDELLERYLNEVALGPGVAGVAAASEDLFRVEPAELTVAQGATLAAVIRAPVGLDPRRDPDAAIDRRDRVLRAMHADGLLDDDALADALAEPLEVHGPIPRGWQHPYVVAEVLRTMADDARLGPSDDERVLALHRGGLRITTTIDPRLQDLADRTVARHLGDDGPQAALVAIDAPTGEILALHGGQDFEQRAFNLATQGRRSPGSALKPLAMAAALRDGWPDHGRLPSPGRTTFDLAGGETWEVSNYGRAAHGDLTLDQALVRSSNTAFAHLATTLGTGGFRGLAEAVGLDRDEALGAAGPAAVLGGLEHGVTAVEMAAAFTPFATGGQVARPRLVAEVRDGEGRLLVHDRPDTHRVLDEPTAARVHQAMRRAVTGGTGRAARVHGVTVAGKTGTSQQRADTWFVGIAGTTVVAVWVGHPDRTRAMPGATGGGLPARIFADFVAGAHDVADLGPTPDPPDDDAGPSSPASVAVPDVAGTTPGGAGRILSHRGLRVVVQHVESDEVAEGLVASSDPGPGTRLAMGSEVVVHVAVPPADDDDDAADDEDADEDADDGDEGDEDDDGDPAEGDEHDGDDDEWWPDDEVDADASDDDEGAPQG